MFCQRLSSDLLNIEHKDGKPTASGDFCIFLPQRACRRIARVFERCIALQFLFGTKMLKCFVWHIYLAAHFEKLRRILQLFGNAADSTHICGDVLADYAVAAGRGPYKLTVLILQTAGQPIDLDFDHIFRFDSGVPHTAVKIPEFVVRKRIQKALHLHCVGHFWQLAAGCAAHLLCRRRRRDQLRKLCFQRFQLPCQGVILKIFQLGSILIIV